MSIIRALTNVMLGDGHFWKHPESRDYLLVWTSVNRDWLEWKYHNLLPANRRREIGIARHAGSKSCFENSKTLYVLHSTTSPEITNAARTLKVGDVLTRMDLLDLAIWYLDDGCCVHRSDSPGSYRVSIAVGGVSQETLFGPMESLLGTRDLGRIYKNNSRATENNKSWIMTKSVAVQVLASARQIAPPSMLYKVPLW